MQLVPQRHGVPAQTPSRLPLLLLLEAPPPSVGERAPLDLALVLDRSGSMQGPPLEMAREAAAMVVRSLAEQDRVAVVAFDSEVDMLVPLTPLRERGPILKLLETLTPRGSTALYGAWATAASELATSSDRALRRVVVLTDGEANVGLLEPDRICNFVGEATGKGVQTTTLGFGNNYNEVLLRSMAASGNGNHFFVERPGQLTDFFNLELAGLEATVGREVELQARPLQPGVKIHVLQDLPMNASGGWRLSDLQVGAPTEMLLEVEVPALPAGGPLALAELTVAWTCPSSGDRQQRQFQLELPVLDPARLDLLPVDPRIQELLALRDAALAQQRASAALQAGQAKDAERELSEAIRVLDQVKGRQSAVLSQQLRQQRAGMKTGDSQSVSKKMMMQSYGSITLSGKPFLKPRARGRQLDVLIAADWPVRYPAPYGEQDRSQLIQFVTLPDPSRRLRGMLMGAAIGDCLGSSTRGKLPKDRAESYGRIADYVTARGTRSRGEPSELTWLLFTTLGCLVDEGDLELEPLARALASREVAGEALGRSRENLLQKGLTWDKAGVVSAGNGALVRVAALVTARCLQPGAAVTDAVLGTGLTHRDSAALSASAAWAQMLFDLLRMDAPPPAEWWWERYVEVASSAETDRSYTSRAGAQAGWAGRLSEFVGTKLPDAWKRDLSVAEAARSWGSDAYLLETVPTLLYCLARHAHQPEECLIAAINDGVDSAALGLLVGTALGALHGVAALPTRWLEENDFKVTPESPGAVLRTIDLALDMFSTPNI